MTKIIKITISLVLLTTIAVISIAGWLSSQGIEEEDITLGAVSVNVEAYFSYLDEFGMPQEKRTDIFYIADPVDETPFTKNGIYKINVSLPTDPQFIENFRVNVEVFSSVETYFRIAIYEQMTLTYISNGKKVEVATTQPSLSQFAYNTTEFYDNRDNDGYFYFKNKILRQNPGVATKKTLISGYIGNYNSISERYSLQMGFIIDAVQAIDGPQINWGLPNRPWDDGAW